MALDAEIKQQLEQYLALVEAPLVFKVSLDDSSNSKQVEEFLDEIVAMSDQISVEKVSLERTPSFEITREGQASGTSFS